MRVTEAREVVRIGGWLEVADACKEFSWKDSAVPQLGVSRGPQALVTHGTGRNMPMRFGSVRRLCAVSSLSPKDWLFPPPQLKRTRSHRESCMVRPCHLRLAAEGSYRFTRSTDGRNSWVLVGVGRTPPDLHARVTQVKACARRKAGLIGKRSPRCCYSSTAKHAADQLHRQIAVTMEVSPPLGGRQKGEGR